MFLGRAVRTIGVLLLSWTLAACVAAPRAPNGGVALPAADFRDVMAAEAAAEGLGPFYAARDFESVWLDAPQGAPERLSPRGLDVLDVLATAGADGVDPAELGVPEVREALGGAATAESFARAEVGLTAGLVHYLRRLGGGGVSLAEVLAAEDVPARLFAALPWGETYRVLRGAYLEQYRLARRGAGTDVPAGGSLETGDSGARVARLGRRLAETGDLEARGGGYPALFDGAMERAVRRFQARHGLTVDGIVGPETRAALNVGAPVRARMLAAGLVRYRELLPVLSGTGIVVNVAAAEMRFFRDGETLFSSRVIVGRPGWDTPAFDDLMTTVVLNPYWIVPPRIAKEEVIPRVRRDPAYLAEKNMRVLTGWDPDTREIDPAAVDWRNGRVAGLRFRQEPGPGNALGAVKFLFPNHHHVYLHDTPDRTLFARSDRRLSHGCVRVEKALELASLLLRENVTWSPESLERLGRALAEGERLEVRLDRPVAIHLVSLPAWADGGGVVHFARFEAVGPGSGAEKKIASNPRNGF